MTKLLKYCYTIFLCSFTITAYAQSGATLYAGPTFTNFDLKHPYLNAPQLGYRAGLDVRIGDDTFWMLFGGSYNETYFGEHSYFANIFSNTEDKIQFAGIKFNLSKRFFPDAKIRPMISGGMSADYLLSFGDKVNQELGQLNTLTAYWNAAAGIQFQAVFFKISYEKGIKEYFTDYESANPSRFVFSVGFFF